MCNEDYDFPFDDELIIDSSNKDDNDTLEREWNFDDDELPFPEVEERAKENNEYFVVEGDPQILEKLDSYAKKGVRSVSILTEEEIF